MGISGEKGLLFCRISYTITKCCFNKEKGCRDENCIDEYSSGTQCQYEIGLKKSELRTRAPKIDTPFKVLTYESGLCGRHKVVNEWVCKDITTWLMYMGIPAHLSKVACVSNEYIWQYCNRGHKNIDEMHISDLIIYDNGVCIDTKKKIKCERITVDGFSCNGCKPLTRPPQSWCYVVEGGEG